MATKNEQTKIETLQEDVTSLKFDMDRIIKPGITDIKKKLDEKIYPTKTEFNDYKNSTDKRLDDLELVTKNSPIVERVVFGLVGLILLTVATAVVTLVIIQRG